MKKILFVVIIWLIATIAYAQRMTVYSRLHMQGKDKTAASLPWIFGPEKIDKRFGFKTLLVYFCKDKSDGSMDMNDVDEWMGNLHNIPPGCHCMINRESYPWWPYDNDHGGPRLDVIQRRAELMRYFTNQRPDVKFGYFSAVPLSRYFLEMSGDPKSENMAFDVDVALKPIANESVVLFPEFYVESKWPLESCVDWIHKSLTRTKTLYPDKQIIPIIWPHWYDVWRKKPTEYDSDKFDWTENEFNKIRVSGLYWAAMLKAICDCGINDVAIWMQGYPPFDENAGWFQETLKVSR